MDKPSYPFRKIKRELLFEFDSVSESKLIHKVIAYELIDDVENIFNLSLVDKDENGQLSDLMVSNNQDMEKVLSTVVQTLGIFFTEFEGAKVFFKGSTSSRTRLYRMVIAKFHEDFKREYSIFGFMHSQPQVFEPGKEYEAFLIAKKV
ncbi:DUF6934 family protein [Runella sp.]|uniref:DUF6934 family protein n=1 Tax=Runella sp. TaxID=1960881 RepID=UPI003D15151B